MWGATAFSPPIPTFPRSAYKGRYVASLDTQNRPSPWMGEGGGGGERSAPLTPSCPFPTRGEGILTYLCQPAQGGRGLSPPGERGVVDPLCATTKRA
jgi:hypothetical protein